MYAEILTTLKINNDIAIIKIIGVFRWYKTRLKEKIANLFLPIFLDAILILFSNFLLVQAQNVALITYLEDFHRYIL